MFQLLIVYNHSEVMMLSITLFCIKSLKILTTVNQRRADIDIMIHWYLNSVYILTSVCQSQWDTFTFQLCCVEVNGTHLHSIFVVSKTMRQLHFNFVVSKSMTHIYIPTLYLLRVIQGYDIWVNSGNCCFTMSMYFINCLSLDTKSKAALAIWLFHWWYKGVSG